MANYYYVVYVMGSPSTFCAACMMQPNADQYNAHGFDIARAQKFIFEYTKQVAFIISWEQITEKRFHDLNQVLMGMCSRVPAP